MKVWLEMEMEIKDVLGQVIEPGDTIAAAFRTGNIAELRVGTVLGFGERGNELTVKAHWTRGSLYGGTDIQIHGEIEAQLVRFVKLGGW